MTFSVRRPQYFFSRTKSQRSLGDTDSLVRKYTYRKIPKISPGAYIFQRPFLRGLFLLGLINGGKFAFQNRLG